jgi:hypothetical protein
MALTAVSRRAHRASSLGLDSFAGLQQNDAKTIAGQPGRDDQKRSDACDDCSGSDSPTPERLHVGIRTLLRNFVYPGKYPFLGEGITYCGQGVKGSRGQNPGPLIP